MLMFSEDEAMFCVGWWTDWSRIIRNNGNCTAYIRASPSDQPLERGLVQLAVEETVEAIVEQRLVGSDVGEQRHRRVELHVVGLAEDGVDVEVVVGEHRSRALA